VVAIRSRRERGKELVQRVRQVHTFDELPGHAQAGRRRRVAAMPCVAAELEVAGRTGDGDDPRALELIRVRRARRLEDHVRHRTAVTAPVRVLGIPAAKHDADLHLLVLVPRMRDAGGIVHVPDAVLAHRRRPPDRVHDTLDAAAMDSLVACVVCRNHIKLSTQ
jgi:hypothetical protein